MSVGAVLAHARIAVQAMPRKAREDQGLFIKRVLLAFRIHAAPPRLKNRLKAVLQRGQYTP
ncbi:hypothetical protein DDZ13_00510 [Coraliomargarita sinensis]|uniref:Uncharacterized protein n=1 Tax=Coraliomargarita sinensis TaxID=2174842 RepID=A0A317ZK41_9BACT|nr:hypothetical protein DDZ13_00510 [Coraliomargarita sinensis]